jgi:hypothetical protein
MGKLLFLKMMMEILLTIRQLRLILYSYKEGDGIYRPTGEKKRSSRKSPKWEESDDYSFADDLSNGDIDLDIYTEALDRKRETRTTTS